MSSQTTSPDADFSFVRYANCWEDADLLIKALQPAPGKRILSIASAGDNSLSLIASGAAVVAADLNPAQLACAELRRESIRVLDQPAYLRFSGVTATSDRLDTYQSIRPALSTAAQHYWDSHSADIAGGFIHAGKFEHYFGLFRTRILPWIHRRATIDALMQPKPPAERATFYAKRWNTLRWRLLFQLFFSRHAMGKLGRDPEFFKHVEGKVSSRILARAQSAMCELDASENPYLSYILTGNFTHALPHYLRTENYGRIQANIDNLTLQAGAIDAIAEESGPASFDGFNLSDIFEYLSPDQCTAVYSRLLGSARPGARMAYWNMLVPRSCPPALAEAVSSLDDMAAELFRQDKAFFYSRFLVEEIR